MRESLHGCNTFLRSYGQTLRIYDVTKVIIKEVVLVSHATSGDFGKDIGSNKNFYTVSVCQMFGATFRFPFPLHAVKREHCSVSKK